jgi:hypothetical protein
MVSSVNQAVTSGDQPTVPPGRDRELGPLFTMQQPPTRIGQYVIRRLIGEGGMGAVYEAEQIHPHRTVAVKVLRRAAATPTIMRRFEAEAQLLARLKHACIAQVFEAGTQRDITGEIAYFAMEYVEGALAITDYASTHALTVRQRVELFARVCEAVQHGHERGVIHRDLKPGNILVDGSGVPKVIDFGVARVTDGEGDTFYTEAGQMIGTLQYMSPEQCGPESRDIDIRTDVYSLGVVLFELLSGRLPYYLDKSAMHEAAGVIQREPPARLGSVATALRGDLEVICAKALAKDRDRRYRSALELRDDLLRYLAGEPIRARADSTVYLIRAHARRFVRRHPFVAILAVLAATFFIASFPGRWFLFERTKYSALFEDLFALALPAPSTTPPTDVRVVALQSDTDFSALAAQQGLSGVDPANLPSLRRLHGRLLERLAVSGASAVAVDINFRNESEFDADLSRGLTALRDAGIGVVLACTLGTEEQTGAPKISPRVASTPGIHWGGATVTETHGLSWIDVAVQRGPVDPAPTMALIAAGLARHPGAAVTLETTGKEDELSVMFWRRHPTIPSAAGVFAPPTPVKALSAAPLEADEEALGAKAGDIVWHRPLRIPEREAMQTVTLAYQDVINADETTLRAWFSGSVVVLGDHRPGKDEKTFADGRTLFGPWAMAAAIQSLIRGDDFGMPHTRQTVPLTIGAALLGLAICWLARGRTLLRMVLLVVAGVAVVATCLVLFRYADWLVNPAVLLLAVLLGSELLALSGLTRPPAGSVPAGAASAERFGSSTTSWRAA